MPRSSGVTGWGVDDSEVVAAALPKGDKLVRDRIPEIIIADGGKPKMHKAKIAEYKKKLSEKLIEEAFEYSKSGDAEELADLLEVIRAICDANKISLSKVEEIRKSKSLKRGGFKKRIILDNR